MRKVKKREAHKSTRQFRRVSPDRVASQEEMKPSNTKVRVTMYLDLDVLNYFKQRAEQPHAAPYQTQINRELRIVMENGTPATPQQSLVNDEQFIAAVAERVRERTARRRTDR